jgi:hypothetical protein
MNMSPEIIIYGGKIITVLVCAKRRGSFPARALCDNGGLLNARSTLGSVLVGPGIISNSVSST